MPAVASVSCLLSLSLFLGLWHTSEAVLGAIDLDNYTFDKVVSLLNGPCLVKFDKAYAYGEAEDEFKALCKLVYPVKDFVVAQVSTNSYGDKQNMDLAARFNLSESEFPAYFLLNQGDKDSQRYTGPIKADGIARWLRKNNVRVGLVGTLPDLDTIVKRFLTDGLATSEIEAAKRLAAEQFSEDRKASMYVKIMEKVKQVGESYIAKESTRVEKILEGKMTPEKTAELNDKLKILTVFASKDEL
eukprot:TRINITY_DN8880_c0_g1_i3.p1 TRINITY_DN8880_c0_g1~~TRINITY_DN8880_c0_g1_i3.p1  ORF type:complete len:285 (+),score=55.02 TRINITY_DN8880_c0_g1_i3:124-855(+)